MAFVVGCLFISSTYFRQTRMNVDTSATLAAFCADRRVYSCVSKRWNAAFGDERCWQGSLQADFQLFEKRGPIKNGTGEYAVVEYPTFGEAWLAWREYEVGLEKSGGQRMQFGSIWMRAISSWATIRRELAEMGVLKHVGLRPGNRDVIKICRTYSIPFIENDRRLLEIIRALWGQHDGQSSRIGVFGCTSYYDHFRSIVFQRLVSVMSDCVESGMNLGLRFGLDPGTHESVHYLDNRVVYRNQTNAVPSASHDDCLLVFFESFARDLAMTKRTGLISSPF